MIKKILIANRGEIAVRIIRACAELGITSVAVYTDADRHGLHVKKADESYYIGPDSQAGYLSIHRMVNLARASGCDAIHPGYGFLSENAEFAQLCESHSVTFIGPSAAVIQRMGDKLEARAAMIEAGVPVVPGCQENLKSLDDALALADSIGYPVMLKATNGGGGRGIRRCENASDLQRHYDRVLSETAKAFGSAQIFMEKAIIDPCHIEVQILGDTHGNMIHLFERDCSIQRRHQKLLEVAPSPQLNAAQRILVGDLAVRAAQAVGYHNAGTVEFLLDSAGNFYFMEMNTRLQVEHPITEMITGIDLVQAQINVADGKPLPFTQQDVVCNGFAIEFRINAEDPQNDFLPSFGRITRYFAPGGPGVRTDGAIYTGYYIPPHYDSMLAKLIVWAQDWDALLRRGKRALNDIGLYGVKSTIPYHLQILDADDFIKGQFNTGFIDAHPELTNYSLKRSLHDITAAVAAVLAAHSGL